MARQLRRRIDSNAAQRRRGGDKEREASGESGAALGTVRTHFSKVAASGSLGASGPGSGDLQDGPPEARRRQPENHLRWKHIFLDNGDFDRAGKEAAVAYELGREKQDFILMSRARLLSCMVENAKLEEGVSENGLAADPSRHAHLAERYAVAAVKFAKHTQNQQVLARTHIWLGLTQSNEHFGDMEAARHSLNLAMGTMKADPYQPHWDDLKTLKMRVIRGGSVDETLRSWSQGSVGDKTFREISDEFAELIIPKIWEREDRKIARVARKLSISPEKGTADPDADWGKSSRRRTKLRALNFAYTVSIGWGGRDVGALRILRANTIAYTVIVCLFCFVAVYQLRISLDTVRFERSLAFFVPFVLEPFTDRVVSSPYLKSWEHGGPSDYSQLALRSGDELLNVNGRPFRGIAVYLGELWKKQAWHLVRPSRY